MTTNSVKAIKALLLLFLVFAGLILAKKFLIPFAFGIVLAMLFMPLCRWLEGKKVPRILAALLCILVIVAVFAGIIAMLSWQMAELAKDAPQIKKQVTEISGKVNMFIADRLGISREKQTAMLEQRQQDVAGYATTLLGSLGYTFVDCILALVYMALMLYYRSHLRQAILKLAPMGQTEETRVILHNAARVSQQYLTGLAKVIVGLWIMYSIGFSIAGVKNPFFFAFLCGLLEIVPFIGNLTGSTITVLVSVAQGASLPVIIGIVATYGTVQFLQGWVLEPLIVGPQVKINPLFTIIVLVIGEQIWGIPGMVLAIPLTGMAKIAFDHIDHLKPFGFMIGETREEKATPPITTRFKQWFMRVVLKRPQANDSK